VLVNALARARAGNGFSIVELMTTIAVLAVLLAVAVPSLRTAMRRSYVSSTTNSMVGDLTYARAEAAGRHKYVSICRSSDGASCDTGGSKSYASGWLVYAYDGGSTGPNQAYSTTATPAHELLRVSTGDDRTSVAATDEKVLTFNQSGLPVANSGRTAEEFVICVLDRAGDAGESTTEVPGRRVLLNASGGVTTAELPAGTACTI
jgi:type IV fimbrial biogenesis protein FimT